jgi:short-subunit dehydrogenase
LGKILSRARRAGRPRELADEPASQDGEQAEAIAADLADESQRDRLAFELEQRGLTVEIVVNAGFGIYRPPKIWRRAAAPCGFV